MEVTLAQHRADDKPEKADFLAQFNQIGSGTLATAEMITSPTQAEFHDTEINETTLISEVSSPSQPVFEDRTLTASISEEQAPSNPDTPEPHRDSTESGQKTLLQRSLEIASLEARLAQQRQIYAKRPRIKRLTSLSTKSSVDAFYLNAWRRKIEKVGNLNYPAEAKSQQLFGSLRLLVTILPDGTLKHVHLLESSGEQILDDAAIRIAQLASPFGPFPDELRESTDELEIIRTWQFRKNASLRSF
ncbi:MAG: TonB family protein [Pseudomonadota bacterium]